VADHGKVAPAAQGTRKRMSGKTMKLLRKTASKTKADYKLLKGAYKQAPAPLRAQGKRMMTDLVEVERQHAELAKFNLQPPIEVKGEK
jgi:hypothetical protein